MRSDTRTLMQIQFDDDDDDDDDNGDDDHYNGTPVRQPAKRVTQTIYRYIQQ